MKYQPIEESGRFSVEYSGTELDALALGTLELQLHKIATKVALQTLLSKSNTTSSIFESLDLNGMLSEPIIRGVYRFRLSHKPSFTDKSTVRALSENTVFGQLIRLRTDNIRHGSLFHDMTLHLVDVISNPDSRAVLQGFGGNLLYAIYESGLRGIEYIRGDTSESDNQSPIMQPDTPPNYDPYDVGDNLREIVTQLIANSDGAASNVTIKHKLGNGESEVQIRIGRQRKPRQS